MLVDLKHGRRGTMSPPNLESLSVLIVAKPAPWLDALRVALSGQGCDLHASVAPEDALKLGAKVMPDVILLDVTCGSFDGMRTCSRFRQLGLRQTCIVAICMGAADGTVSRLAGFDGYVLRPDGSARDEQAFLRRVRDLCERQVRRKSRVRKSLAARTASRLMTTRARAEQ